LYDLDSDLIRAALTPMSESDRYCIAWLRDYQETIGDADPTSTEYSLNQGTIQSQYQSFYVPAAMQQLNDMHCIKMRDSDASAEDNQTASAVPVVDGIQNSDSESEFEFEASPDFGSDSESDARKIAKSFRVGPVGYARFCELWRVVFPDLVNRPFRSIMGKCKICGLIDVGLNLATDAVSCSMPQ
jgi:hypothetical protein